MQSYNPDEDFSDDDIFLLDDDFDFTLPSTPASQVDFDGSDGGSVASFDDDDMLSLLDTDVALFRPGPSAKRLKKARFKESAQVRTKRAPEPELTEDVTMDDRASARHTEMVRESRYLIRSFANHVIGRHHIKVRKGTKGKYPLPIKFRNPMGAPRYNWPWRNYKPLAYDRPTATQVPDSYALELQPHREVCLRRNRWQQSLVEEYEERLRDPIPSVPEPEASSEPSMIEPLREEIPRLVRNVLSEARRDQHDDLILEDSDSVQLVSAEVLERMEEILLTTLRLRNHPTTRMSYLSAKSAGDWDSVMHAARLLQMPERVIERAKLRMFAIQERTPLAKKMCFEEMPWRVPPGGRYRNSIVSDDEAED